ncbi:flagellar basal body-associated FliL family protein [Henriciella sp.]|uniref:flagellar basal body-associated FliL family protein n=1 Tax=Henriciella sp. TaxID=1968823 RepID=UPI0026088A24|nr:flagellar basal body-associated FliL family protein [Henriciella sp.]
MAEKETSGEDKARQETDNAPAKSSGGLVKYGLLGLVSLGCSFGTVFMLAPSGNAGTPVCAAAASTTSEPLAREDQAYVELNEIIITIGNEPATRYVKIKTAIVADKGDSGKVGKAELMLKDAFIGYLRSLELSDLESAAFYPRLREQLSRRAELVLGGDVSQGVLITEFLLR